MYGGDGYNGYGGAYSGYGGGGGGYGGGYTGYGSGYGGSVGFGGGSGSFGGSGYGGLGYGGMMNGGLPVNMDGASSLLSGMERYIMTSSRVSNMLQMALQNIFIGFNSVVSLIQTTILLKEETKEEWIDAAPSSSSATAGQSSASSASLSSVDVSPSDKTGQCTRKTRTKKETPRPDTRIRNHALTIKSQAATENKGDNTHDDTDDDDDDSVDYDEADEQEEQKDFEGANPWWRWGLLTVVLYFGVKFISSRLRRGEKERESSKLRSAWEAASNGNVRRHYPRDAIGSGTILSWLPIAILSYWLYKGISRGMQRHHEEAKKLVQLQQQQLQTLLQQQQQLQLQSPQPALNGEGSTVPPVHINEGNERRSRVI